MVRATILRGSLPGGVTVQVDSWDLAEANTGMFGEVAYQGSLDALLAADVLTDDMLQARAVYVLGNERGLRDSRGFTSTCTALSPGQPLTADVSGCLLFPQLILDFPGVRELMPEGLGAAMRRGTPRERPAL